MKRATLLLATLCVLPLVTTVVCAQSKSTNARIGHLDSARAGECRNEELGKLGIMVNQLSLEMRRLRFIVLNLELDNQQLRIAQLEQDLRQVQAEQLKLAVQESDLRQGIAELDTALSGLSPDGEDRTKLATAKADLEGNRLVMVYSEQQAITQREAELTRRLQLEQQRLQELSARGERLKGEK